MLQLICHAAGDYCLQNDWMAKNKTSAWWPCFAHVLLYTLPFLLLTRSPAARAVIFGAHLVIDRFGLGRMWPRFWGVGQPSWFVRRRCDVRAARRRLLQEALRKRHEACGDPEAGAAVCASVDEMLPAMILPPAAPDYLRVWLEIINDDVVHLAINYAALAYL